MAVASRSPSFPVPANNHRSQPAKSPGNRVNVVLLRIGGRVYQRRLKTVFFVTGLPPSPARDSAGPSMNCIASRTRCPGIDYIGMIYHGFAVTHIDALCHIFTPEGKNGMYNGFPISEVTSEGANRLGIEHAGRHG